MERNQITFKHNDILHKLAHLKLACSFVKHLYVSIQSTLNPGMVLPFGERRSLIGLVFTKVFTKLMEG